MRLYQDGYNILTFEELLKKDEDELTLEQKKYLYQYKSIGYNSSSKKRKTIWIVTCIIVGMLLLTAFFIGTTSLLLINIQNGEGVFFDTKYSVSDSDSNWIIIEGDYNEQN